MNLFGFQLTRAKATTAVPSRMNAVFGYIRESFGGAWQSGVTIDSREQILANSAVYACVARIAGDVSKLRLRLVEKDSDGVWSEVRRESPFWTVLRKPNRYQTRIKFIEQWLVSKLLYGNTYILKQRDNRGIVNALYILHPQCVTPLVADDGGVYYQLSADALSGLTEQVTVPASEIIHDMMVSLFHPLVGVSPIYACAAAATVGNKIQKNSNKFFENMSRPSGMLTAPSVISDETANRLKAHWEANYSGDKLGRLAVLGDGLSYASMTIPASDAQLIEQLNWTSVDVARAFSVPLYKINAGPVPAYTNVQALNTQYYSDCLQGLIESIELLLDEGLAVSGQLGTEFDLDGLLRMDFAAMSDALGKATGAGIMAPNEARFKLNLKRTTGGDTPYLQQQNWPLAQLANRPPPTVAAPVAPPAPAPAPATPADDSGDAKALAEALISKFTLATYVG